MTWAVHVFREYNTEADAWAEKGVQGRQAEWADGSKVIRSEVTGPCGFWHGICRYGVCGASMLIKICS